MPELVYLMRRRVTREVIEQAVSKEYGIQVTVNHFLDDLKAPILKILSMTGWKVRHDNARDFRIHSDITSSRDWGCPVGRYRTVILSNGIMGNQLGYNEQERPEYLEKMINVYTGTGEYSHLRNYFMPPYFAVTSEPTEELQTAFEKIGLEVRLVKNPGEVQIKQHYEMKEPKRASKKYNNVSQRTAFDGKRAKEIRRQNGLTQTGLARLLNDSASKQTMISSFETGMRLGFSPQSEFVKNYLEWLGNHGYDPFGIKGKKPEAG